MKTDKIPLSLYLHIPFCVRKCFYCDFLSGTASEEEKQRYLKALHTELKLEAPKYAEYRVETVFFGGGTPSLVSPDGLADILDTVRKSYDVSKEAEITIEVNPGTVDEGKLISYRQMGINRLSIGLQSAIDKELACLGRIHKAADFFKTYEYAVKTGFNNINVDLMSAIPLQTEKSYRETLRQVLSLKPQPSHISAYSLIIEEGTPFYDNTPELPDEETDRKLYKITNDILKENGYHRYEISNYAKKGCECRHNQVYWKRGDYAGFGIGAASLVNNVRFSNCRDKERYVSYWDERKRQEEQITQKTEGNGKVRQKGKMPKDGISPVLEEIKEDIQLLSIEEQMEEYMFLGLRLTEGIDTEAFQKTFGKDIESVYPKLSDKLEEKGLLCSERDAFGQRVRIYLSELGLDVSNQVMAEFLLT